MSDQAPPVDDPGAQPSPFHEGEIAVQQRCGVHEKIDQVGRIVIRDAMPLQHRQFFSQLPLILVGSLDGLGRPWASVLAGNPGFVHATDARTLRIDARPDAGDPLGEQLADGVALGLLGIELSTRRRNRMNGTAGSVDEGGFTVHVQQSFGNCPQYIQSRSGRLRAQHDASAPRPAFERVEPSLGGRALELVRRADTMFIASASPRAATHASGEGADVSHRGGKPGFVRVRPGAADGRSALVIPDFRGNFLFNTLGNLTVNPRAGLLFVDFASGDLLQLTGSAEVVWEGPELEGFTGAQRLVVVTVEEGRLRRGALAFEWSEPDFASQLEDTGSWSDPTP
jgi:predicted pyridoxine 5'-phosphate oxidase superfamily flavin-nucleotide-binding protein